jgi:osmoprotectant transport system substrate-binding protein
MRAMTRMAAAATALVATATASTGLGASLTSASAATAPHITIGSASFAENETLGYVYGDALKAAGIGVTVKSGIGQRETIEPALFSGKIDMTPEYLGAYLSYLNPKVGTLTVAQTYAQLKPLVTAKGAVLGNYSNAADANAVAVTQATATKYHLKTIADLKGVAANWTFGGPAECQTRPNCYPGLTKYYGVKFKAFKALDEDGPITIAALKSGAVQAATIFSSDTTVSSDHFVVLSDPKDFQGAGNVVPEVRKADATPAVMAVLNKVSAALTTADLVSLNVAVETDKQDPSTVAQTFVTQNKL